MSGFTRKLGQQPGIQLNPIAEAISTIDAGAADQAFACVARLTRGRIDRPFVVTRGNFFRMTGPKASNKVLALNEAKMQVWEGLNSGGALAALVMRLTPSTAEKGYIGVTLAQGMLTYDGTWAYDGSQTYSGIKA